MCTVLHCAVLLLMSRQAADGSMDVDDDGGDFLLKDNGDDLDLRLERLEVSCTAVVLYLLASAEEGSCCFDVGIETGPNACALGRWMYQVWAAGAPAFPLHMYC